LVESFSDSAFESPTMNVFISESDIISIFKSQNKMASAVNLFKVGKIQYNSPTFLKNLKLRVLGFLATVL